LEKHRGAKTTMNPQKTSVILIVIALIMGTITYLVTNDMTTLFYPVLIATIVTILINKKGLNQ
jgi:predicted PurR-regulated permease PerM